MNAKFFEEQRREMVAAIRAIAEHMAPQIGKTALDERVFRAMAKVPRHEFVPVEVQSYAYLNRPIPNYAGTVFAAGGIRATGIPSVLINRWGAGRGSR